MGISISTHIAIINDTCTDIVKIIVSDMDSFDWVGKYRPDKVFNGIQIEAGQCQEKMVNVRRVASRCPFTMTLMFKDESADTFRMHQKYVRNCCPGFKHLIKTHDLSYEKSADNKLTITVKDTKEKLQDETAKARNREGQEAMKQMNFKVAIEKFDEASTLANEKSTIDSINSNRHEACKQNGERLMQEGWDLEGDTSRDNAKEAENKFAEAKLMFEQTTDRDALNRVNLKIEGNELYNEADNLRTEAIELYKSTTSSNSINDYTAAQDKYCETLVKLREAKDRFQEGLKIDEKFADSEQVVNQGIKVVETIIDNIRDANKLQHVRHINVNKERDEADIYDEDSEKSNSQKYVQIL